MKKILWLGACFISTAAYCQWTASGTHIYNSNSGNIGIGTSSPYSQLNILQSANSRSGGVYVQRNGSTYGLSIFVNSEGYGVIGSNGDFTRDIFTMDLNTGNIGIGTTSPGHLLDVRGGDFVIGNGTIKAAYSYNGTGALTGTLSNHPAVFMTNSIERMRIDFNGNLGIGTTTPTTGRLVIGGTFDNSSGSSATITSGLHVTPSLTPVNNPTSLGRSIYGIYANLGTMIGISSAANNTFADVAITPATVSLSGGATLNRHIGLYIDSAPAGAISNYAIYSTSGINYLGGNVGIGVVNPAEKLSVNGNVSAKKIIVTQSGWSDHVFSGNYKLRALSSLETFIKQNKHLPEIPSEKEVQEKGISIGENQALLLKKIEELTLYLLEMDKRCRTLEAQLTKLERIKR